MWSSLLAKLDAITAEGILVTLDAILESNRLCIIQSNYGDDSIALTQWAFEAGLRNIIVAYIDTGFASIDWAERIVLGAQHAKSLQFEVVHLKAAISFQDAVRGRGSFPCSKFQWCTGILKALPLLDWLDKIDLNSEALMIMAKRKAAAPKQEIPEWIQSSEHHNFRSVWHPLVNCSDENRDELLKRAGISPHYHRSLECHPCVNSTLHELASLKDQDIKKVVALEQELAAPFFAEHEFGARKSISEWVEYARMCSRSCSVNENNQHQARFYRGCGNHFGCGL